MVMAFAKPIQFLTNNYGEAQVVLFRITWCYDNQWSNFILELHSMILVHVILGKAKATWRL